MAGIAAFGMPLVLAAGCTTTRPNPIAMNSPATPIAANQVAGTPATAAPTSFPQPTIPARIQPLAISAIPQQITANGSSDPLFRLAAYAPGDEPPTGTVVPTTPDSQLRINSDRPPTVGPPAPPPALPPPDVLAEQNVEALPIDLPSALRLTNANNPTIALARERVEEAYAAARQADVLWLPNLQAGPQYNRHDGRDQQTPGQIIETSKQNLFINGGTTLDWNTSEIVFGKLVAQRLLEAQSAAAQATGADVQLSAALAYLDLLQIQGTLGINAATLARAKEMLDNAAAADKAGLTKTAGDINRARTEFDIRREEQIQLEGNLGVASARLAHLLLLRPTVVLKPADMKIVPIELVPDNANPDELVATALSSRPEVQEGRAESAAALARLRQAKLAPLMPHVDVTYFGGEFGGGVNSQMSDFGARSDGEIDIYWQLHNLGAGDAATARAREAQFSETNFQLTEIRAQIGEEVTTAYRQVEANRRSLDSAEQAVREAVETWRRLREASFGMAGQQHLYDPLEPLIAERDLNQARVSYLNAVIGYNRSQFQLFWAMGQPPLEGPAAARPIPVGVPVVPDASAEEVPAPATIPPRR